MVWRKKKIGTEVSDAAQSSASRGAAAAGAQNSQTSPGSQHIGAPGQPSAQNLDTIASSWVVDADEFKVPVRIQGSQRPYTIPRNYRIIGDITSARRIVIDGEFAGGVLEAPTVTVTAGGCLRGRVKAGNLQVAGAVDADVAVGEALEVSGRGQLAGTIDAPEVKIWPGAILHGATLAVGSKSDRVAVK
jgi:cytoskeletal protein CcmA (bactofilin family)